MRPSFTNVYGLVALSGGRPKLEMAGAIMPDLFFIGYNFAGNATNWEEEAERVLGLSRYTDSEKLPDIKLLPPGIELIHTVT